MEGKGAKGKEMGLGRGRSWTKPMVSSQVEMALRSCPELDEGLGLYTSILTSYCIEAAWGRVCSLQPRVILREG